MFIRISHTDIEKLERHHAEGKLVTFEVMLLLAILRWGWVTGKKINPCKKRLTELAKRIGKSETTVRRAMDRLEEIGAVSQIYRTRVKGQEVKATTDLKRAQQRIKSGAKQLPSYFKVTLQNLK